MVERGTKRVMASFSELESEYVTVTVNRTSVDEWVKGAAGMFEIAEVGEGSEEIDISYTMVRSLGYRNSHRYSEPVSPTARTLSETCSSSSTTDTRTSSSDMKVNADKQDPSMNLLMV